MKSEAENALKELASRGSYSELKRLLGGMALEELAARWGDFSASERLVLFKLLDAARAEEFWALVSFEERYFLLMAQPLEALGPALEKTEPSSRRLFHELPRPTAERMSREMISQARRRA